MPKKKKNQSKYPDMRKLVLILIAAVLPLLLSSGNVRVDRVVLQNGDTLTGTLVKVQGGKRH